MRRVLSLENDFFEARYQYFLGGLWAAVKGANGLLDICTVATAIQSNASFWDFVQGLSPVDKKWRSFCLQVDRESFMHMLIRTRLLLSEGVEAYNGN